MGAASSFTAPAGRASGIEQRGGAVRSASVPELVERLKKGDVLALARAISWIENEDARGLELLDAVYPDIGRSYRIGISGPPGAGKSTLVDGLTERLLNGGSTVGIIAVDQIGRAHV